MAEKELRGKGMLFFTFFWCAITGVFDGFLIYRIYNQYRANSFSDAEGKVTHSEVTVSSDSDGTTYGVDIRYTYQVDGKQYQSDRYRFGQMSSSDNNANTIVKANPVGKKITVYYDPETPSEAVLLQGVQGSDLFMGNFLLPFNMVGLCFLGAAIRYFFRSDKALPAGGLSVREGAFQTRVGRYFLSACLAAAISLGGIGFISIFVIAFTFGFHPPLELMKWCWTGYLSLAVVAFLNTYYRSDLLVLDFRSNEMIIPKKSGQKSFLRIPFDQITDIELQQQGMSKFAKEDQRDYLYAPSFTYQDGDETREASIKVKLSDANSESLLEWLKEKLGR